MGDGTRCADVNKLKRDDDDGFVDYNNGYFNLGKAKREDDNEFVDYKDGYYNLGEIKWDPGEPDPDNK